MNALVADLQVVADRVVDKGDVEGLCRMACAVREYAYETQRPELLRVAPVAVRLLTDEADRATRPALRDGAMVAQWRRRHAATSRWPSVSPRP